MTEPLSPAAQAVRNAAFSAYWSAEQEAPERLQKLMAAAALRAVADQVVPSNALYARSCCEFVGEQCRAQLLAIADELEGKR